jgi:protein-S-isoprenylcysteine O-methyltransferase Ste14
MGLGVGIVLLVIGLVLLTGAVDLPSAVTDVVDTGVVGWICVVVGVLGLVLFVTTGRRRSRVEQRHDV